MKMLDIKKAIYRSLTFHFVYDILQLQSKEVKKVLIFEKLEDLIKILGSDN